MMQPQYEAAPRLDDGDGDDSSSTEVDESLMGDDPSKYHNDHNDDHWDGATPRSRARRARLSRLFHSHRWLIDTFLLLAILGLLIRGQYLPRSQLSSRASSTNNAPLQIGGDFTGVRSAPFAQQITKFSPDSSYAPTNTSEFFTEEVLGKWNKLMPRGMGFVWVNDTHRYHDLPKPIESPEKTVFTTSVTHHLHCLFAIVQTYSGLTSGLPIPDDHHWHMLHCFDYMRQAIMCSADIALEGHAFTFPKDNSGSDGWDSKHVCKDWDQVYEYLESVRPDDLQQIF